MLSPTEALLVDLSRDAALRDALQVPMILQQVDAWVTHPVTHVLVASKIYETRHGVRSTIAALHTLRPQLLWQRDQALARIDQLTQERAGLLEG